MQDFEKLGVFCIGRKVDTAVGRLLLGWEPWRLGSDGFEAPAWQA